MRARNKTNKVLDIALSEEKFYFPGETIRGSVIVKPKSSMKVNPIIIKFSGAIFISAKEKEVIPLFQQVKSIPINEGKSKVLEPKQYSFPFEFLVPKNNLPSAMDFGKNKTARINYKLTVILDRPMMPESLCPKIEYPVLVLEYVDVTKENFVKALEKQKEVATFNNASGKCHAKLSVPRTGFTRGETIPVNIIVNTFASFVKKESLVIELIRKVKINTSKNTVDEEHILKSNKFDLNIIGPYNFTQSITSHLLIRTTPPTIRYKDRVLRVHYKIRAQVFSDKKTTPSVILELPIVIGTWPRADVPIDDDDDDDIIQNMGEVMISDEIDDDDDEDDIWMQEQEEIEFQKRQSIQVTAPSPTSATTTTNSSSSTIMYQQNIRRSGSNNSLGSISSWRSIDHRRISTATTHTIPITTSTNTNTSNNNNNRNTLPPINTLYNTSSAASTALSNINGYLNRSCSTPDLLSNPPPQAPVQLQQQQGSVRNSTCSNTSATRIIDPTVSNHRNSYYEIQPTSSTSTSSGGGHRSTKSFSIHPGFMNFNTPVNQQQHRRVGSDEFNSSASIGASFMSLPSSATSSLVHQDPDVPNHTLTFLSSTPSPPPPPPPRMNSQPHYYNYNASLKEEEENDEEDEDDDDSDDDLFAIIEKKKRKEEKEQRKQRQQQLQNQRNIMYNVPLVN